jgi:hypothetical protein
MSPEAQSVLNFILENPGMKNRAIASAMNIPMGTVNAIVVRLRKDGHLKPAVTDLESPSYGQCWPVEPTPVPTQGSPVDMGEAEGGGGDGTAAPDSPTPTPKNSEVEQLRKELAVERNKTAFARQRAYAAEDLLFQIEWLCGAAGLTARGDAVDFLCVFLERTGVGWAADALRERRRLQSEIAEREDHLRRLRPAIRARMERKPETDDRCRCGREATKVEGEQGFTQCDPCFHREGGE